MDSVITSYFKYHNNAVFYNTDNTIQESIPPQMLIIIMYSSVGEFEDIKIIDINDEVSELNPEQEDLFI